MSEIRVKSTGTIKLFESDNTSSVTIASPASLGGDRTITIPDADVNLTNIAVNTAKTSNATHSGEVTGATALTIADNIVDEANLKISNTPTNGHFLSAQSSNSGGLTWAEAGGGDLVLLASVNASNSGSVTFGNSFSSAYYNYVLYFSDVVSASNPDYFGMRLSTSSGFWDGGSNYGNVKMARRCTGDPGSTDESTGDSQYNRIPLTVSGASNNSNWAISGRVHFNNPQSAESYTICDYQVTHGAPNGSPLLTVVNGAGNLTKTNACTGIRFLFESGNISTGHFRLYGVKNA